jgi:hypothetical protein
MGPLGGGRGGGGRPVQGGFSSFQSFDSARPEGQQMQASYQSYGEYNDGRGYEQPQRQTSYQPHGEYDYGRSDGGGSHQPQRQGSPTYADQEPRPGSMFAAAVAARRGGRQNLVRSQPAAQYAPSGYDQQPSYQHQPQYAPQYEAPRGGPMGGARRQVPQEQYYEGEDDGYGSDGGYHGGQQYQPQQAYGGCQQQQAYEPRQVPREVPRQLPQGYGQQQGGYGGGRGGSGGQRGGGGAFSSGIWGGGNPFR